MPVKKDLVRTTAYVLEKQVEDTPVCVVTTGKVKTAL